jgi:hypothetical protein
MQKYRCLTSSYDIDCNLEYAPCSWPTCNRRPPYEYSSHLCRRAARRPFDQFNLNPRAPTGNSLKKLIDQKEAVDKPPLGQAPKTSKYGDISADSCGKKKYPDQRNLRGRSRNDSKSIEHYMPRESKPKVQPGLVNNWSSQKIDS